MKKHFLNQSGQVLVLATVTLTLVLINTILMIGNALSLNQGSKYSVQDVQAISLAEAGVDKAIESLNNTAGAYSGESETFIGKGSYSVVVTTVNASSKIITATGYIPNKTNPKTKRVVQIQISNGAGVSFSYGVQVGNGGLEMFNNSTVNGSLYSNSNITMSNGSRITGDVYVAGGVQPTADQQSDCTGANCADYLFGKTISAQSRLDIAQSFQPSQTQVINKATFKLKKFGTPSDLTIRILGDNSGKPNKNSVLASGTLTANLVTTQYGMVEVAFTTTPTLTANTPYWLLIDTTSDNTNYWSWSEDIAQSYNRGASMWSTNWQAGSPVWTSIPGDLGFATYMGGTVTSIIGSNTATIGGNAHANTLASLTITKGAYYQTASNISAGTLYPNSTDPVQKVLPISDANIQSWKDAATTAGVYNGNVSGCQANLPAGKYVGNINLSNGCNAVMHDPIWVTGTIKLDNGSTIKLDPSYGAASGTIMSEGAITLANNGQFKGTGTAGSYLLAISNYDSRVNGNTAIDSDNGSSSCLLYAGNGIIYLHNNASLKEVSAWKITLDNGSTVTYDTGLASLSFSSGPSGNYSVIKGSYQVK